MKKGIHPDYHPITVVLTSGKELQMRSTYGKPGDKIVLDIDHESHPAWTGQRKLLDTAGQLAKFNKRFQNLGIN